LAVANSGVQETDVERRVVDDPCRAARELDELRYPCGEVGLALQVVPGHSVHFRGAGIDLALRIKINLQCAAGRPSVDHFNGRDLDDAMAELGVEARGFGV
jgi:hypothetical protein